MGNDFRIGWGFFEGTDKKLAGFHGSLYKIMVWLYSYNQFIDFKGLKD
jgi:hypothetical protein